MFANLLQIACMRNFNCYVVWTGRKPGIYYTWSDCEEQIKGFKGAKFKGFKTHEEAVHYLYNPPHSPQNKPCFQDTSNNERVKVTIENKDKRVTLEGSSSSITEMMKSIKL